MDKKYIYSIYIILIISLIVGFIYYESYKKSSEENSYYFNKNENQYFQDVGLAGKLAMNPSFTPTGFIFNADSVNFTSDNLTVVFDNDIYLNFDAVDYIEFTINNKTHRFLKDKECENNDG